MIGHSGFGLVKLATLILMIAAGVQWAALSSATAQSASDVLLVELEGPIGPAPSDFVSRALDTAGT